MVCGRHPSRWWSPLLAAIAIGVASTVTPLGATDVPPGFVETVLLTNADFNAGVNNMTFAPDGDLFLAAKYGWVWVYSGGTLTFLIEIPTTFTFHAGILGMTVDPDYAQNKHLWVLYTTPAPMKTRLSRFTYNGTTLADEAVVLEGPLNATDSHGGGGIGFASDKTIFFTTGDDNLGTPAADPFDLRGAVVRLNRDGTPAAGNPFLDGAAGDPFVYSTGLREPYRLTIQPGSDNVFIGDVGGNGFEEIDIAVRGGDFGWPAIEGPSPPAQPGVTYPVIDYVNGGSGCVIMGDFAEGGDLTPQFEGSLFYADYSQMEIRRVMLDASNLPVAEEVFADATVARPVELEFGPDGSLYYLVWGPSELRRISYAGSFNEQPVAVATLSTDNGSAPLDVTLDGTSSYDPDDESMTYQWDLGDGSMPTDPVVAHSYPAGEYFARLTVSDGSLGQDSTHAIRIVSGNNRPVPAIANPADGSTYNAGQNIAFDGAATDAEEGSVPCSRLAWTVVFHHSDQASLVQGPEQGACAGSYVIPLVADTDPEQWYEIRLQAEDTGSPLGANGKLEGSRSIEIRPNVAEMSFATTPELDLQLTLDGSVFSAPLVVTGVVDQLRTIGAMDGQLHDDGHTYTWLSWSDGQGVEHEIPTPPVATTFTADFGCDVLSEVESLTVARGAGGEVYLGWGAIADACLVAGGGRYRVYASATAAPASAPGSFPDDPAFTLVGTSATESFGYLPAAGDRFFLVVGRGTDGRDGPVGHYGF